MFGRIRASPSSSDTLEGSPSKILKHDSFSIYEATLMKLKMGAQRDLSAFSKESDENINDSATSSSILEGINVESNCVAGSASSSQHIQGDDMMIIDRDCSSLSTSPSSDQVSIGTWEQPRRNDVSIVHFFSKLKDSRRASNTSYGEAVSTENSCPASISSSPSESHYRSETESIQSSPVCELLE
ncbi:uncharacterized protein G2W53_008807 [Senna tora]|uniref:Uncharacterized protein n=1 Tax=Senna tora TaxID=362788 RepID=A0A834WWK1_9FABA|nr:uncharacterized protein G2W53_008807 [Senna tora]